MKKVFALFMVVVLTVIAFSGCGSKDTKKTEAKAEIKDEYSGEFRVGFSRVDITPKYSVPLGGFGNAETRMSDGFLDRIVVDSVAVSDQNNETMLLINFDNVGTSIEFMNTILNDVAKNSGVNKNNIFITCSHSHSCPTSSSSLGVTNTYNSQLKAWIIEAAVNSLNDRAPSEIYYGETEAAGISYVRHYFAADGGTVTDNHDSRKDSNSEIIKHCTDVDPTLYVLKFARKGDGKKDILYTTWRSHPQMTGGSGKYDISADWIGAYRSYVEENVKDCYCSYYQGAAGNINPTSRLASDNSTSDHREKGKQLGDYLLPVLKNLKKVEAGNIKTSKLNVTEQINHDNDKLSGIAHQEALEWKEHNNVTTANAIGLPYGIYSPYHANRIVNNSKLGKESSFDISVAQIGDIGFTFVPYEMFDTNSCFVLDNSPYKYQIVLGYTNGKFGYVASTGAYEYGCYEADIGMYRKGTGEDVAEKLVQQLKKLKG